MVLKHEKKKNEYGKKELKLLLKSYRERERAKLNHWFFFEFRLNQQRIF